MSVIGFLLLVVGVGIGGWTTYTVGWRRTIGLEVRPPHPALPDLVLAGPYQLVRHPRALAVVLISLGAGAMRELLPIWLCALLGIGALLAAVCRDRQLGLRFGEAYRRYQRAVPFLVPRRARGTVL